MKITVWTKYNPDLYISGNGVICRSHPADGC